ncbi:hypothetical protein CP532_4647 [Ophiocordyceps camponoti-leonardi (nom. inval.)]|nr:hypothetical protein CP532_4647 [Ophiocordyceps camponoti-leonardi (nom. inval.)]
MASSTPPKKDDMIDASLVGKHCQYAPCNQLDFLPFRCQACLKDFCADHRIPSSHECTAPKKPVQQHADDAATRKSRSVTEKACDSPACKAVIGTPLTPSIHCRTCRRDYCLKHRLQEEHDCNALVAAAKGHDEAAEKKQSALDRLRAWSAARMRHTSKGSDGKAKSGQVASQIVARNLLKRNAKGRTDVPENMRVYLHVEAEPNPGQEQLLKGDFFYHKDWVVGKVLDDAAKSLQITNINNRTTDERQRLRIFHIEGGRMLDFSEKIGTVTESGNTIALLRGVGPSRVLRKRPRESQKPEGKGKGKATPSTPAPARKRPKTSLYDDLDASVTPRSSKESGSLGFDLEDSDSSLTSLSDLELEDAPAKGTQPKTRESEDGDSDDDDDDDIEFEDVAAPTAITEAAPVVSGDLELTLQKDTRVSLINLYGDKRGPTKRERKVRSATHCVHVMLLLWHNAVRNSWLCDAEVQATMLSLIPPRIWSDVERWRRSSALSISSPTEAEKTTTKGKTGGNKDSSRDWGSKAKKLEEGAVDMSRGDPLFRLMQSLVAWWKQRFRVTAPGLRKRGYMALERLDRLTKAFGAENGDGALFGEKISGLEAFRERARACEGSRDVGAQLFTALLRGLGLEARMVANLPCLGFGWNKLEDADPEKEEPVVKKPEPKPTVKKPAEKPATKKVKPHQASKTRSSTRSTRQTAQIATDSEDELRIEGATSDEEDDDESVTEVKLPITPIRATPDKDLEYPHYWTEVLSPVTNRYLAVDAVVKGTIATNRDLVESFEPRGAKADRARQVMAYLVGYSPDGTAKDVTVRYLKRRVLPGRSKGVRMPPEKVAVYDRHGKVKRYEQLDWFKTAMSGYRRGDRRHPLTEADHEEDATDLKPGEAAKKEVKEGAETLQYYKQSSEFVLERHLKREEALKVGAAPVKIFKNKVKGGKVEEEDVFLRKEVVQVKSAETWHKQGRAPKAGEQPLKRVPYRAATLNRKREIYEVEAATGEKVLQGLFSLEQTDWIIPPPIKDGVIPKNEYGNIDLFAEHMCPEGAVHIPYRGAVRVCKRLEVDFAEAVVGFEFGNRMAVPVIQGVVVAVEHHERVMEELARDEAERTRREDEKRRKAALGQWRRFIMGLRIAERIRLDYGEVGGGGDDDDDGGPPGYGWWVLAGGF